MRVINISLSELENKVLMIGFEGENQITQVRINAAEILTDYPNATPTLIVKPLFGFAYPVIVAMEGTDVVWEIDNSVLNFHGDGEIQLTFTQGTVIAKSYVGRIRIKRSLAVNGEAPDPIETWEQAATAKLAEVDAQIDELEDMVEAAEAAKDQAQDIVDDAAADIQAAGAAQVQVVQAAGEEVLDSIPSDYTELSDDVSGLKSAMSLSFGMITVTNEEATTVANSYRYYLSTIIPKGAHCIFENTSNVQYTLNLGDGTNETSYGAIPAGTKKEFYAELNASVIRCYCPANSTWKFALSYGGVQDNSVAYFSQTQTDAKKATARNNIGAASKADFSKYVNKTDFETFSNNYMIGVVIGNSVSLSSTTTNWVYSSVPLFVKKGNTVHCSTRGSGMCAIATAPTNNFSGAVCRCPANDDTAVKEYTYTAESDCYAWVSGRANETTAYVDFKTLYDVAQQITGETYTVKKDGTGDYQTFTGMLDALKNNANEKTVYVYPGTYDIFDELGGAEYVASITNPTSLNWADVNKLVPDNTTIIGVGNVVLSYEPEDSEMPSANHAFLFAALNIGAVSCRVENITIKGKNCRYVVHIENSQSENNLNIDFDNVRVLMYNGGVRNAQAVGTGIGNNAKWAFNKCKFHNDTNSGCFTSHTNVPLSGDSASISFENCVFTIEGQTASGSINAVQLISAYNPSPNDVTNYAYFNNCYCTGKIALVNGYDTREVTKKQLFDTTLINCICNGIFKSDTFEAEEAARNYSL